MEDDLPDFNWMTFRFHVNFQGCTMFRHQEEDVLLKIGKNPLIKADTASHGIVFFHIKLVYSLDLPSPPRMPVANKGLGWDSGALKMFHVILVVTSQHPGWGGRSNVRFFQKISSIERFGRSLNPLKFGMLTPKIATFERKYLFRGPSF